MLVFLGIIFCNFTSVSKVCPVAPWEKIGLAVFEEPSLTILSVNHPFKGLINFMNDEPINLLHYL
jgi:hypothetical protein